MIDPILKLGPGQYPSSSCTNYQTLTLAINSNNSSQDNTHSYNHLSNNRRTIKTNEAVPIKNNDNEFIPAQNATFKEPCSDSQLLQLQKSEIKNIIGAKTIHLNSPNDYYIKVNGSNKQCIQVNQSYLKVEWGPKFTKWFKDLLERGREI